MGKERFYRKAGIDQNGDIESGVREKYYCHKMESVGPI
jgi:hypothetical protein